MELRKIVITALALSATAAIAHGNKQTSSQTSGTQPSVASATQATDGSSNQGAQQDTSTVQQAQQALNDKGFDAGTPDGKLGPHTKAALNKFQQSQGISASGQLDGQTLAALGVSA